MKRWLVGLLLVPLVGPFLWMIIVVNSKRDLGAALEELEANIRRNEQGEVVEVGFNGPKITDAGLEHLKEFVELQSLDLQGLDISDKGLVFFSGNRNLEEIELVHTLVAGTAFQSFYLPRLRRLNLTGTKITDAGLAHLKGLTNLKSLDLTRTKITDAGLADLKGLAKLQSLNLNGTQITDAGLVHIKGLTNLQSLSLTGTNITDAGLIHLKGATKLFELSLYNTKVTDAGIADLKKALPTCEIKLR